MGFATHLPILVTFGLMVFATQTLLAEKNKGKERRIIGPKTIGLQHRVSLLGPLTNP